MDRAYSSLAAKITQSDGRPLPLGFQNAKATLNLDWESGEAITVDFRAVTGFGFEVVAGIRYLEIDGRKFRLVEVDEFDKCRPIHADPSSIEQILSEEIGEDPCSDDLKSAAKRIVNAVAAQLPHD